MAMPMPMGAMAAGLAAMGAIIMPIIIMGAGAGASLPPREALLGSSTVSTMCTIACRNHSVDQRGVWSHALQSGSTLSTVAYRHLAGQQHGVHHMHDCLQVPWQSSTRRSQASLTG